MEIFVPVLMIAVGFHFFRRSFRRTKFLMDTEVRDVF